MVLTKDDIDNAVQEARNAFDAMPPWKQRESQRWIENLHRIDREMTERRVPFNTQ